MPKYMEVAKEGDVADGGMREVTAEGRKVLLAKVGGRYYAVGASCPHMGGSLASGKLEGTVVTCPRHGSQFNLSDGHMVRWAQLPGVVSAIGKAIKRPRGLEAFPVRVEAGKILVEI
jgi:3-phenylpropionate/trans-cinnamate dioxygenase ferredoxin subunit